MIKSPISSTHASFTRRVSQFRWWISIQPEGVSVRVWLWMCIQFQSIFLWNIKRNNLPDEQGVELLSVQNEWSRFSSNHTNRIYRKEFIFNTCKKCAHFIISAIRLHTHIVHCSAPFTLLNEFELINTKESAEPLIKIICRCKCKAHKKWRKFFASLCCDEVFVCLKLLLDG